MKLMGIDYGLRRIGLAISDGIVADPLGKVQDLTAVLRLADEHGIEKIIIGLPDPRNSRVRSFGERLAELSGIPVEYWDESYSTRQARQGMIAAGKPPKDRRDEIDQNAAAVILQSYLDAKDDGVPL
jgi:putative Holliday junction resolvase